MHRVQEIMEIEYVLKRAWPKDFQRVIISAIEDFLLAKNDINCN